MSRLIAELDGALEQRAVKGLRRERRIVDSAQGVRLRVDGRDVLHFGSNDYLGLAGDPRVVAAAQAGAARYGAGAGASHLISGHFAPHDAIERELAAWIAPCAKARALLFSTGYLANLAIVTALVGRGDAVFADKLNHACLNDAALLSRADFVRYAHGDVDALEKRLAASGARRKLIATDAVFSMDGDIAELGILLELAEKYDAWLAVDDAHGFGVLGDRPNQVDRLREDVVPDEVALLSIADTPGEITEQGLRTNVSVGIRYLDAWLHGVGAAAIDNLMEDAATAEISRSQVWQWVRTGHFDEDQVRREAAAVEAGEEAKELFLSLALAPQLVDFLTVPAYTFLE